MIVAHDEAARRGMGVSQWAPVLRFAPAADAPCTHRAIFFGAHDALVSSRLQLASTPCRRLRTVCPLQLSALSATAPVVFQAMYAIRNEHGSDRLRWQPSSTSRDPHAPPTAPGLLSSRHTTASPARL